MATIPTQNAVPSEAPRDLKFNSGKIDEFVTSLEHEYKDRFGRSHLTIEGIKWMFDQLVERFKVDMNQAIIAAGYIPMDSFQHGAEIAKRNEILRDETTGEYYRWDGDLPKSVPVGSTPESAGGVGAGKWVGVGDASLRTEIANSGDKLVGSSFGNTVYADYSRLTIARKASFADGGILNSDKEAALAGDGFFYVYKGAYPVTITPGSSPDSNWLCCGLLNGYPLHNFKNFKGKNSDTDALTKCIDFNNFVHIDENTEIYIEPIVLTKSMTIRIDGVVYADRNCPDLCVLISATGVDDITIEGHGRIDGNEKEVTSSKMRLIHLTGGGNRHRVYGITLGNNYISEADYTGYAESTLWIDGGVEHEVRGVRLVDYGLEGISVCAKRSIISDIVSTSSYGKTGGTRCLNYSTIHTLGSDFIISRIISYNTGASAIGCDSTHTVITDIDIDTVRYQHGIGVGHPNKPGSYTIINNCIIKNIMHPSGNNRGGIGIGEETHDVRINNVKVIGSTNMGINVSSGATEVDISNFYAESCDVALSIFNANCSVDGMKVKSCSNGISKRQVNDKLTLSNVNLTGAITKILGSEDNISGVNVIFNSDFPRQGVVQISNRTLPVSVENPNIRPWSTLSITPNSANSASSIPYVSETLYGILRINAVNSPTHYAGVKWFIA
ncbi:hypothetical protein [Morganella morganii]|uniref:tail fiber/spike domain-containing protein n=1 Tax=Morganella morganii TaxID=582 RepID=UPI001BD63BB3|nr:hypothetical protein [Morganella morganii]MBS9585725.1 hypothetical protein [Morganella morganii subsp. morganii]QWL84340.1 hypothetical protein IR216_11895 [Morganella morganii subsp. morganii]